MRMYWFLITPTVATISIMGPKAAADDPKRVSHVRFTWALDSVISTAVPY